MKIEKIDEEVRCVKQNTITDFVLTNDKGIIKKIRIYFIELADDIGGYDDEESIFELVGKDEKEKQINETGKDWEDFIFNFLGANADADEVLDELHDRMGS